jgi:NAD(P)-dependent dehydrogenase (short-subunit alcohol dehydrogenase family)
LFGNISIKSGQVKKTVLIIGGDSCIGKATASKLASLCFQVVFVAHNLEKTQAVKNEIIASSKNIIVNYILADLSSKKQVKE